MADQIAWAGEPPANPTARIWTPATGESWVVVLGPWRGVWVHWMGRRSLPCLAGTCPASRHRRPLVWLGYTPIARGADDAAERVAGGWTPAILPLGPGPADEIRPALGHYPGPVVRLRPGAKGRGVEILEIKTLKSADRLPDCPDVEATLYRVWQMRPPSQNGHDDVE